MLTPANSALIPLASPTQRESRTPWYLAFIGCIYYGFLGFVFLKTVPIFTKLFDELGVEIPLPARLLLSNYIWLVPVFYLAAIALTTIKQLTFFDERQNRIANRFLLFAGAIFPPLLVLALYSPLLFLIYRLHSAK